MKKTIAFAAVVLLSFSTAAFAAETIKNWSAPSSWAPPSAQATGGRSALTTYPPLPFIPITPCRVADTRVSSGFPAGYGQPSMAGGGARNFTITGQCGIPVGAQAVSFNFVVWNTTSYGDFKIYPTGGTVAPVSTLNWGPGVLMLANAATLPLGTSGQITVVNEGPGTVDLIVDVNGYYGDTTTTGAFLINSASGTSIMGQSTGGGIGVYGVSLGSGGRGVYGANDSASGYGIYGFNGGSGVGVYGLSPTSVGVRGKSVDYNGVWAESTNWDGLYASGGHDGAYITGAEHGVLGQSTGTTGTLFGLFGATASTTAGTAGVFGQATGGAPTNWAQNINAPVGVLGVTKGGYGVVGVSNPAGWAGHFISQDPTTGAVDSEVYMAPSADYAATFYGNVNIFSGPGGGTGALNVAGFITKAGGGFKIDDPLDPENKYLYHSFVESPDMMNIYNGIVELDAMGEAIVQLPAYFEALNKDFRYQLTSIGRSQPNLYVADEVRNLQFRIAGGKPHAKASWQVTGVRQDPVANANRYISEVAKEPEAKGYYLHPAAYKQPADKDLSRRIMEVQKTRDIEKARNESSQ